MNILLLYHVVLLTSVRDSRFSVGPCSRVTAEESNLVVRNTHLRTETLSSFVFKGDPKIRFGRIE